MAGQRRVRAVLRWVHRWIGLTVGILFAVVSLSGSLLLFQPQFFDWAHGEMIPDDLSPVPGSIDRWVENARTAAPGLHGPVAIWRPHVSHNVSDAGMLVFTGAEPGGLGNMGFIGVLLEPATGNVLDVIDIDRSPAYAPLFFHRDLWAADWGKLVNGIMAVGSLLMLMIGLYLWWPRQRLLRKLSPQPWRMTLAYAARLHDWLGVWSLLALIVLAATGLYLVQPRWVEPAPSLLPEEHAEAPARACGAPMGFDAAIAAAQALVPAGAWTAIYPHDEELRVWEITFKTDSDTDAVHGDIAVEADLACGIVRIEETAETRSPRHTAEVWLTGLHDGTVFGTAGEIIVSLLGLAPLILAWTGLRMWFRRRRMASRTPVALAHRARNVAQ